MITRTIKEMKLRGRFAARKLGLSGWQIHQICLQDEKLIYIPIPKNACTSIKQGLHQIEFGCIFDTNQPVNKPYVDVHDYYKKRSDAFSSTDALESSTEFIRFAIVRDPVKRLISCYRNRVIDLEELKKNESSLQKLGLDAMPDINTFVLNLKEYRRVSKSIEHHSRPQASFFGNNLNYLDKIFPFDEIDQLHQFLKTYRPGLKFLKRKSGGTSFSVEELTDESLKSAVDFYHMDYQLLWDYYSSEEYLNRI
ncbi:MAG: sulfotransferase family 2 domain-containing protein [Rhodohalobacter sp.]